MATVIIPALLRKLTGGKDRTLATGATLKDIIDDLERQFPGFRERVVAGDGLVGSLAVSIDGEVITGGFIKPGEPDSEGPFVAPIGGGGGRVWILGNGVRAGQKRKGPGEYILAPPVFC